MKLRLVGLLAVLVLAAGLLSSCRTNVGVAATVDGHRISENSVDDYVLTSGPRGSASADATDSSRPAPKPLVVQYLVRRAVLRRALAQKGGVPSSAQLAAVRSRAEVAVTGSSTTGAQFLQALYPQLDEIGIKRSFAQVYVDTVALIYTYGVRENLRSLSGIFAQLAKLVSVRINPRYGTWVPSQFATDPGGSSPDYLQLQSTLTPTAG